MSSALRRYMPKHSRVVVFNDGNKRTALACALAYLEMQGVHARRDPVLEDAMVMLAEGTWTYLDLAWLFGLLAGLEMYGGDPA
jgi:death-on-curing protein